MKTQAKFKKREGAWGGSVGYVTWESRFFEHKKGMEMVRTGLPYHVTAPVNLVIVGAIKTQNWSDATHPLFARALLTYYDTRLRQDQPYVGSKLGDFITSMVGTVWSICETDQKNKHQISPPQIIQNIWHGPFLCFIIRPWDNNSAPTSRHCSWDFRWHFPFNHFLPIVVYST
jgi:hypothetical protein